MARKKKRMDRITLDSIAAEKAGMSYGQYKAQHPHTQDGIEADITPEEYTPPEQSKKHRGVCVWCGSEFYYTRTGTTRKYCPDKDCADQAALARNREYTRRKKEEAQGKTLTCAICGKAIPYGSSRRVYCSEECATIGNNRKNKKRKEETNGNT